MKQAIVYAIVVTPVVLAINYMAALAGSPQSLWAMQLIGLM